MGNYSKIYIVISFVVILLLLYEKIIISNDHFESEGYRASRNSISYIVPDVQTLAKFLIENKSEIRWNFFLTNYFSMESYKFRTGDGFYFNGELIEIDDDLNILVNLLQVGVLELNLEKDLYNSLVHINDLDLKYFSGQPYVVIGLYIENLFAHYYYMEFPNGIFSPDEKTNEVIGEILKYLRELVD